MFTGVVLQESPAVTAAANAGISLSTVPNVHGPFQLTVLCTREKHIEGHCINIHKGKVSVGFWVTNCAGYAGRYNAYTGWNSVSRIFIQELPKAQA